MYGYVNALDLSIFKDIENTSCKNNPWVYVIFPSSWQGP